MPPKPPDAPAPLPMALWSNATQWHEVICHDSYVNNPSWVKRKLQISLVLVKVEVLIPTCIC